MPAPVIAFETALAARDEGGGVVVALIDGPLAAATSTCVAILTCSLESARAAAQAIGSVAKDEAGE